MGTFESIFEQDTMSNLQKICFAMKVFKVLYREEQWQTK